MMYGVYVTTKVGSEPQFGTTWSYSWTQGHGGDSAVGRGWRRCPNRYGSGARASRSSDTRVSVSRWVGDGIYGGVKGQSVSGGRLDTLSQQQGLAAEAQPAKLRKVGGYHLGANDEHAAVLTPLKLRNIGGTRAGRQNSPHFSGFAGGLVARTRTAVRAAARENVSNSTVCLGPKPGQHGARLLRPPTREARSQPHTRAPPS